MSLHAHPFLGSALAAVMPGFRAAIEQQVELDGARMRVCLITPPGSLPVVLAECERRREHMTELAALQSVAADLMEGRWTP